MTVVELSPNGHGSTLTDAEKRVRARADWCADPGNVTGRELGDRYGLSEEWGRKQIRAARRERDVTSQPPVTPVRPATPRPARKPVQTAQPAGVPWLLRYGRMAGFVLVAVVCAVMSYHHIRDLATLVGLDNPEWVPLGIDGLMVVCTCTLMIDKGAGRASPRAAQIGLALGIVGSLAANALAVRPGTDLWSIVRMVLACYPTATLAVVLHLVFLRTVGDR